ncbi:SapC family protein [Pseudomonadales bacterium]|nr:SapC family protein [Pseudomonadales bacterium]
MPSLLFYDNPVALNKAAHKDLRMNSAVNSFGFARKTNSVVLAGVEFSEAAKEYPIVFAKSDNQIVSVALLGLRDEENLFVDADGHWNARYIPGFVRRYPFVLAETGESGQRAVCIDKGYPGFDQLEGEPLFVAGEPAPVLAQAMKFLEEYQVQYERTETFIQHLQANDLLKPLNAKIDLVSGQQFNLNGLLVVDEKKLLALEDSKALELLRSGELAWVYCHLMSLGCMTAMIDRVASVINGVSAGATQTTTNTPAKNHE